MPLRTHYVTTKENGTGLGLPVSISILEYYNAALKVDTSSAGTTIKVYFPAAG
jgi:nitrogen-specific signal transduction histidine kinase